MSSLTADQVALQLQDLDGWTLDNHSLVKTFEFADFASVIAFMTHVAFYCQELEHYPQWQNYYNILTVRLGDANQPAVQSRDVQLAKRIQTCLNAIQPN
ncbi:MAG: 4a-hydroxytetrahydrobiopterin dehydratase [Moraxella sp.]|nr:4a-hydroxytetrahydrobiopterin dehydratase [Moraxella sp.]